MHPSLTSNLHIRSTDMPEQAEEIKKLRNEFEAHVSEYRQWATEFSTRQEQLQAAHEQNMQAISALTKATDSVVNAWVVANGVQRFIKWLSSFAIVGAGILWVVSKLPPDFFKGA